MRHEEKMVQRTDVADSIPVKRRSVSKLSPTAPQTSDLEPLGLFVGSLLRWSWLIVGFVVAVASTAWLFGGSDDDETVNEATVRLGLTQETVWPFYDVELEAGRFLATTSEFKTAVEDRVGYDVGSIVGILPDSLAVFDLTVTADSPEKAVEAANVGAAVMVELTVMDVTETHALSIERSDTEIADVRARIADVEAEGAAAGEALTTLYNEMASGNDDPALLDREFELKARRQEASAIHSDLERTLVSLETARASAEAWFTGEATFRIIREAVPGEGTDSSQVPVAIASGFGALLLASAAVIALDRRVGSVRSSWQLANVAGAPVHTELSVGPGGHVAGCGALADVIEAERDSQQTGSHQLDSGLSVFGVINLSDSVELTDFAEGLSAHGLSTSVVIKLNEAGPQGVSLVDVSDEYRQADTPRSISRLCDGLILLVDKQESLASISAIVAQSSRKPGLISAAFVRDNRR